MALLKKTNLSRKRVGLTIFFILIILLLVGISLHKEIIIRVDGKEYPINTFAFTAGDALRAARIFLVAGDRLSVPATGWLRDGTILQVDRAAHVTVMADGKFYHLFTPERTPRQILALARVNLNPEDQVWVSGKPVSLAEPLVEAGNPRKLPVLQVRRALSFTFQEGERKETFTSTALTVGQALWEAGIVLSLADRVVPPLETPLTQGMFVELHRAKQFSVQVGNQSIQLSSSAEKIGEALAEAGFPLQGLDYTQPTEDQPVPENAPVRLVRVQEAVILEQTPLPFEEQYQPVADLEIDHRQIIASGEYGLQVKRVRIRYEDGLEVSRLVESEWVARSPEPQIIGYGIKIVPHTIKTPDGKITYWRAIEMLAVSYHPAEFGGNTSTASGLKLQKGIVAVDIRYIPFYTRLYIPGYGEGLAADTGSAVIGRIIDLGYSDDDYVSWYKTVTVYFLWPPPENIVYIFP